MGCIGSKDPAQVEVKEEEPSSPDDQLSAEELFAQQQERAEARRKGELDGPRADSAQNSPTGSMPEGEGEGEGEADAAEPAEG